MLTATLLGAEHVRLPNGREFKGRNAETDAARALIAAGHPAHSPLSFQWADGRASTSGTISAYARRYYTDNGVRTWKPHPMAETSPLVETWLASLPKRRKP